MSLADAAAWADVDMILAPDEVQAGIYADLYVLMIAQKGPGHTVP